MSRFPDLVVLLLLLPTTVSGQQPPGDYGSPVSAEQIAAWNIDVRPDGRGLPPGSGSALDGESPYQNKCAICHGEFGEGVDRYRALAGGEGTLADEDPIRTVGSYWPYATTLWDYINRAMPFGDAQSLSADEVYAITAYVLWLNEIIADDLVLDANTLPAVMMPNRDGFVAPDPRPDVTNVPCMRDCGEPPRITSRASASDLADTRASR